MPYMNHRNIDHAVISLSAEGTRHLPSLLYLILRVCLYPFFLYDLGLNEDVTIAEGKVCTFLNVDIMGMRLL